MVLQSQVNFIALDLEFMEQNGFAQDGTSDANSYL